MDRIFNVESRTQRESALSARTSGSATGPSTLIEVKVHVQFDLMAQTVADLADAKDGSRDVIGIET